MHNPEGSGTGPGIASAEEQKAYWDRQAREVTEGIEAQQREQAEAQQQAERTEQEEGARALEGEKAQLQKAWISSGGTAPEFEREWPGIRKGILLERLRDKDEQAMASVRDLWRSA